MSKSVAIPIANIYNTGSIPYKTSNNLIDLPQSTLIIRSRIINPIKSPSSLEASAAESPTLAKFTRGHGWSTETTELATAVGAGGLIWNKLDLCKESGKLWFKKPLEPFVYFFQRPQRIYIYISQTQPGHPPTRWQTIPIILPPSNQPNLTACSGCIIGFCFRGVVIPLIFPKVPQSSWPESSGNPQLPPPLGHPPLRTLSSWWFQPIWKILVKLDHFPK